MLSMWPTDKLPGRGTIRMHQHIWPNERKITETRIRVIAEIRIVESFLYCAGLIYNEQMFRERRSVNIDIHDIRAC